MVFPPFPATIFQSTHPRRVRQKRASDGLHPHRISIHAPAKGATHLKSRRRINTCRFQSTHPRRVRRCSPACAMSRSFYFNPRTREGCDPRAQTKRPAGAAFQSTHPRRVRLPSNWLSHYLLSHQSYCELIEQQFNF